MSQRLVYPRFFYVTERHFVLISFKIILEKCLRDFYWNVMCNISFSWNHTFRGNNSKDQRISSTCIWSHWLLCVCMSVLHGCSLGKWWKSSSYQPGHSIIRVALDCQEETTEKVFIFSVRAQYHKSGIRLPRGDNWGVCWLITRTGISSRCVP